MVCTGSVGGSCQALAWHGSSHHHDACQQESSVWVRVEDWKGVHEPEETDSLYNVHAYKRSHF